MTANIESMVGQDLLDALVSVESHTFLLSPSVSRPGPSNPSIRPVVFVSRWQAQSFGRPASRPSPSTALTARAGGRGSFAEPRNRVRVGAWSLAHVCDLILGADLFLKQREADSIRPFNQCYVGFRHSRSINLVE